MQLLLLVENQLIRSDKEIEDLGNLRMMYTKYFNKLETLWTNFYYNRIEEEAANDMYFKFREIYWEKIEELDCKLNIKKYKRLMDNTEQETSDYINKYHLYE